MIINNNIEIGDAVCHLNRKWKVIDKEYDPKGRHTYYRIKTGIGKNIKEKWARRDALKR